MNRTRSINNMNAVNSASSMHFYDARIAQPQAATGNTAAAFTSTAKLPIETVKRLIASVSRRPNLWIRQNNGQKRYDITQLWQEVSDETQLPADVCRIKWGHLRDNFRKVFIRNTLSDETPTTWRFYNDMRFMEKSVAENIMRQNRYKEQTRYWPDLQQHSPPQPLHPMIPICTLKENVKMDAESMQSFGIYTETDEMESTNKRIKLEPTDNFLNGHNEMKSKHQLNSNNYRQRTIEPENEPDDDDFDEDTATDENDHQHPLSMHLDDANKVKLAEKNQMYSVEVFDVDDDNTSSAHNVKPPLLKGRSLFNGNSETFSSMEDHSNNFHKKTESLNGLSDENDSDRMFLLSLLPYLRNIDGNRKLHVRQKLQNVLIEELS